MKKSYKGYSVYSMTLMLSVCLFYTFNSSFPQEQVLNLSTSQSTVLKTIGQFVDVLSVFVTIILAFLILYMNNFLIHRREQEFGIYMLLGMPKRDISRILIYEITTIGFLSLLSSLLLDALCSQLLGVFGTGMLQVLVSLRAILSIPNAIITSISFTVIFVIIILLNTKVIAEMKLTDLL